MHEKIKGFKNARKVHASVWELYKSSLTEYNKVLRRSKRDYSCRKQCGEVEQTQVCSGNNILKQVQESTQTQEERLQERFSMYIFLDQ